jgi:hypothetical protein
VSGRFTLKRSWCLLILLHLLNDANDDAPIIGLAVNPQRLVQVILASKYVASSASSDYSIQEFLGNFVKERQHLRNDTAIAFAQ